MRGAEHSPERDKKSRTKLGLAAAAAMLASITGTANAETPQDTDAKETSELSRQNDLLKFSREDMGRLEKMVEDDRMPLHLQVKFISEALQHNGPFSLELSNLNLTKERLSRIHTIADMVSARLTLAYTSWKKHPELDEHFQEADKLREATSQLKVQRNGKTEYCNKFNIRDGDEIFSATAFHCISGTALESEYYRPAYSDIAVRYLPKELWELHDVKDASKLPEVDKRANRYMISGRIVTSFSRSMGNEPKVHFSFAMPLPLNKSLIFNPKDSQKLSVLGAEDWMMYFKPYAEGQRNPETGKVNAAGSSGGPVAVEGYGIAGTTSATYEIADSCTKTCHATSFFTAPDILQKAITGEREMRKKSADSAGR